MGALGFFSTLITVSNLAAQRRKKLLALPGERFITFTSSRAAVNSCPSEMIDQIGGWSSGKVGDSYEEVYSTSQLRGWMLNLDKTNFSI